MFYCLLQRPSLHQVCVEAAQQEVVRANFELKYVCTFHFFALKRRCLLCEVITMGN